MSESGPYYASGVISPTEFTKRQSSLHVVWRNIRENLVTFSMKSTVVALKFAGSSQCLRFKSLVLIFVVKDDGLLDAFVQAIHSIARNDIFNIANIPCIDVECARSERIPFLIRIIAQGDSVRRQYSIANQKTSVCPFCGYSAGTESVHIRDCYPEYAEKYYPTLADNVYVCKTCVEDPPDGPLHVMEVD